MGRRAFGLLDACRPFPPGSLSARFSSSFPFAFVIRLCCSSCPALFGFASLSLFPFFFFSLFISIFFLFVMYLFFFFLFVIYIHQRLFSPSSLWFHFSCVPHLLRSSLSFLFAFYSFLFCRFPFFCNFLFSFVPLFVFSSLASFLSSLLSFRSPSLFLRLSFLSAPLLFSFVPQLIRYSPYFLFFRVSSIS